MTKSRLRSSRSGVTTPSGSPGLWRRSKRGQAAVELAMLLPALAILLLVGLDVSRAFSTLVTLTNAARAGVQYGGQNRSTAADDTGMQNAAIADANGLSGMTATATNFCMCNGSTVSCSTAAGCVENLQLYVRVTTSATFKPMFPSLPFLGLPENISLNGSATMLVP